MAAPAYVNAGTGVTIASGSAACTLASTTAGNTIILQVLQDGTAASAVTLSALTNVENLADTASAMTVLAAAQPVGSPTSALQHLWIGRSLGGTVSVTVATTGDDLYYRLYEFSGAVAGTTLAAVTESIANGVGTGTTVSDTGVTTTAADRRALQFVGVNDDLAVGPFAGMSGGTWAEAVAEFASATGTDGCIQLQTAAIASAGTINGGTFAMASGGWGVIGLALLPIPVPAVSSFTPSSGPVGQVVTVTGTGFTGASSVTFGGVAVVSFTVDSATQITATVPASAVSGVIAVTTPGGTGSSVSSFTVTVPILEQEAYRFRNDDGSETGATWRQALNTPDTVALNTPIRIRFAVEVTGLTLSSKNLGLQYRRKPSGGAFGAWTTASSIQPLNISGLSSHYVNGDPTTQQISAGTFDVGVIREGSALTGVISQVVDTVSEYEFMIYADSTRGAADDDTFELRLRNNTDSLDFDTYTQTPTLLIGVAGPATLERSASLGGTGLIATVGREELARLAALSATGALASSGVFWTTLERAVAADATGLIASSGVKLAPPVTRSAALAATGAIAVSGISVVSAAAVLNATGLIATVGRETLARAATLTATASIASAGRELLPRLAELAAAGNITASGLVVAGGATVERSAALAATASIATVGRETLARSSALGATAAVTAVGVKVGVRQRSAALTATAAITTVGRETLARTAALTATGAITASGISVVSASASLSATATIATVGRERLERSASLTATATVATIGREVLPRMVVITAAAQISTAGQKSAHRSAALTATATITTTGDVEGALARAAALAATAAVTATGTVVHFVTRTATLTATGTLTSVPQRRLARTATVSSTPTVTVTGQLILSRTVALDAVAAISTIAGGNTGQASLAAYATITATLPLPAGGLGSSTTGGIWWARNGGIRAGGEGEIADGTVGELARTGG